MPLVKINYYFKSIHNKQKNVKAKTTLNQPDIFKFANCQQWREQILKKLSLKETENQTESFKKLLS